jgi:hypothetical protein
MAEHYHRHNKKVSTAAIVEYSTSFGDDLPMISNLEDLDAAFPSMCNQLAEIFGSRNLESTYQKALAIDLREAGVHVDSEVEISLTYRGHVVGKEE